MRAERLGDHVTFLSGFAFDSKLFNGDGTGMPLIRIRDVVRGYSETFYSGDYDEKYVVVNGEYLIGMDGEFNLAKWRSGPALLNQRVCKIDELSEDLDQGYLAQCLPLLLKKIEDETPFVTVKHLSIRRLNEVQIPLPPLTEQKRIAGILDAADALRAKRRAALAELDTLLQSTFLDMFGDPVTNPLGWERRALGTVTSIDAPMVDPREEKYRQLLHYGPDRIEKDTGELLPALTAEEDQLISGKFLCSPGEILYSKIRPYLNKVALVKQKCLCSADVYPVRPDSGVLTAEYLVLLLRSAAFLDYTAGFSRRANIPKLNRKQFSGYLAPTPPLDLQKQFTSIVKAIESQKTRMRTHLAELDTLFASLQSKAFNGEL